jgi:hypothetical protein
MIKILHNLALFCVKNANFLPNFSAKIFKNHNIGASKAGIAMVIKPVNTIIYPFKIALAIKHYYAFTTHIKALNS